MTETSKQTREKRHPRTPAQRRADLRARAVTLLLEDEAALLQSADSLVIEAVLYSYRHGLTHSFKALSVELMRRMLAARAQGPRVMPVPEPLGDVDS